MSDCFVCNESSCVQAKQGNRAREGARTRKEVNMTYPNAAAGVKKLWIAQILDIVVSVLAVGTLILGLTAIGAYSQGAEEATGTLALGAAAFALPTAIIALVGWILELVGLKQASNDESEYLTKAFWISVGGIVVMFIVSLLTQNAQAGSMLANLPTLVQRVTDLCVLTYTLYGVNKLVASLGHRDIAERGENVMKGVTIGLICSLVATLLSNWIGGIAAVVGAVVQLVVFILYISYLSSAKKVLANE
jgi:hypothetical protein